MSEQPVAARRSALFARRAALLAVPLALVIDLVALMMGLSDEGFGWAFQMPKIMLAGLTALTASVAGGALAMMRLLHQRGRDALMWVLLVLACIAGLAAALMTLLAMAASASI